MKNVEKIIFLDEEKRVYNAEIAVLSPHTIRIITNSKPNVSGFYLITDTGNVYGRYEDYTTLYREIDGGFILSNDGSIYIEPVESDPYVPTLEERKKYKRSEISSACEQIITAGIDVKLPNGSEHFSLTSNDQINLFGKQAQLAAGVTQLEYHQDGHPCRYYSDAEMQLIIMEAMAHVSYHTTYCNSLFMWIADVDSEEALNDIYYGADIPVIYRSEVLQDYLRKRG